MLCSGDEYVYKIMLYQESPGEIYLFQYCSPDAICCSFDQYYNDMDDLYNDWIDRIDDRGWIELGDPLPDCQHDAFLPIRVKGRDAGKPEWGRFEIINDGVWTEYDI